MVDVGGDFGRVDGRIEFVDATEIDLPDLQIDRITCGRLDVAVTYDGQFAFVDRDFQVRFIDPRHFCVDRIRVFIGLDIGQRGDVVDGPLITIIILLCDVGRRVLVLGNDVNDCFEGV